MPTMRCGTSAQPQRASARTSAGAAETELRLELRCDEHAPAAAREGVRKLSGGDCPVGDAMLVASELVTNAVLHSGCARHDHLTVRLKLGRERLLISVLDPGRSDFVARPRPRAGQSGGFGLRMVDQLATRWGSDRAGGHRVWAELAVRH
jgi:serine/threonine-protein kinase RsbW